MPCFYRAKNCHKNQNQSWRQRVARLKVDNAKKARWIACDFGHLPDCLVAFCRVFTSGLEGSSPRRVQPSTKFLSPKVKLWAKWKVFGLHETMLSFGEPGFLGIEIRWPLTYPYHVLVAVCRPKWSQTAKELPFFRNVWRRRSQCCGPNKAMEVLKTQRFS